MPKKFRMVFISVLENEPKQLKKVAESFGQENGVDVDFFGIYGEDADEDPLVYHELVQRTKQADFIYVRVMGDINRFHKWEKYEQVLKDVPGFPAVYSGNQEINLLTRYLFKGTDEEYKDLFSYARCICPENDQAVIWWAMHKLGFVLHRPNPAVSHRLDGIYHKGMPLDITAEDYRKTLDPNKMTVGVVFAATHWIYGTLEHLDALVQEIEDQGMNAIPIFLSGFSTDMEGGMTGRLKHYFTENGKPCIDVLITTTRLTIDYGDKDGCLDENNFFRNELNVPVVYGLWAQGPYRDFEDDKIGMAKRDMQINVIYPELEGNIIGVPYAYKSRDEGTNRLYAIPERINHLVRLAKGWGIMHTTPVKDRKVAILMWQSRPDSGNIGGAAGLDTPESIAEILKDLDSKGYYVENVPANGRELIEEILHGVTNDLEHMSPETVRERAVDMVPTKDYVEQFEKIPKWDQEQMIKDWGDPPGEICVDGKKIIIPGLIKGNVFVGYQPLRGWAEKMEQNIHDPILFAQHQYLEYYRWLRESFGANIIFHMGTHGTIEWLPGKNVGMSQKCDPDVVLDGIPNIYPYIIDDPGEGIQCKRRIESVLDGHMPPAMARANSYPELDEVYVQLQDYFKLRGGSPDRMKQAVANIYDAVKRNNLLKDLNIEDDNDPGPEGFEPYIIPLHEYIEEVKDALIRADLHIMGRVPREEHFDEMVYSITRLDNGDIMSFRDAFGFNQGIDVRKALDDPAGTCPTGEMNSEAVGRIDRELMELLV